MLLMILIVVTVNSNVSAVKKLMIIVVNVEEIELMLQLVFAQMDIMKPMKNYVLNVITDVKLVFLTITLVLSVLKTESVNLLVTVLMVLMKIT